MAEYYIDANKMVTIQIYDDMTEEWHIEKVTIAEALDRWTDEGCPKSIDVEPRKHGRWIKDKRVYGFLRCSECGSLWEQTFVDNLFTKYCPRCGARMDGGEE